MLDPEWVDQGKEYAAFVDSELKTENDLRASINSRAAAVLTGAAGLVTLALAVFAVVLGKDVTLTGWAKGLLGGALVALLGAAVLALIAGLPWRQDHTLSSTIDAMLNADWVDDEVDARNKTASCKLMVLTSLRSGTSTKSYFLITAGVAQIVALILLALSVLAVLAIFPFNTSRLMNPPPSTAINCGEHAGKN